MAAMSQNDLLQASSSIQHSDTPNDSYELSDAAIVTRPPLPPIPPPPSIESLPSQPNDAHSISRPRGLSTASTTSSSVRRKPLPPTASPLATRYSSAPDRRGSVDSIGTVTPYSIGSPTVLEPPVPDLPGAWDLFHSAASRNVGVHKEQTQPEAPRYGPDTQLRQTDTPGGGYITNHVYSSLPTLPLPAGAAPVQLPSQSLEVLPVLTTSPATESVKPSRLANHVRVTSEAESIDSSYTDPLSEYSQPEAIQAQTALAVPASRPAPSPLKLFQNVLPRSVSAETTQTLNTNKQLPKSPSTLTLGSFFGWSGLASPASATSSTFSDKSGASSLRSPASVPKSARGVSPAAPKSSPGIEVIKSNTKHDSYFGDAYKEVPAAAPSPTAELEEMEEELKAITAELAVSIRREMELEDLVERLQSEANFPQAPGKRTSDYFSDSGTSSVKYGGETDARTDEMERLQRKGEREKAQIKLELNQKVQEERSKRKVLEAQIRTLEEKASQVDLHSINSMDTTGRLKELETTCEDLRRRLAEEKTAKNNFEDLLAVLRSELQKSHHERDNLRDEVVPQLRARVEGLEAQAAEHEKLTYENTKMQQEMQALKDENTSLTAQQRLSKFTSIAEEPSTREAAGIKRSNSVTHPASYQRSPQMPSVPRSRPVSMIRPNSTLQSTESRDTLVERLKDVELQRDALHSALKNLLERQEHQNRENKKRIRQLERERDRALSGTPRRRGYNKDVASLRDEINALRKRADEALEQKDQCEKGLSGIKMDLDRAEQEIASLRSLLHDHDVSIPNDLPPSDGTNGRKGSATSDSLEQSYKDLQRSYSESLERIKQLEEGSSHDAETTSAMAQLERSLSLAITERDFAQHEASTYRQSTEALQANEKQLIAAEGALADELRASAKRVEELATQVRQQLAANAALRQRLADTIERGERDQKASTAKIMHMQSRLRALEEAVLTAQQASEERIARHEEEVKALQEAHSAQLQRVKNGIRTPKTFSLKNPVSPLFLASHTPRLSKTTSGLGISISEESKTEFLRARVVELEKALEEADTEMQEVVGRMNVAQMEVMELQNEREEQVRQTRRVRQRVEEERATREKMSFFQLARSASFTAVS